MLDIIIIARNEKHTAKIDSGKYLIIFVACKDAAAVTDRRDPRVLDSVL